MYHTNIYNTIPPRLSKLLFLHTKVYLIFFLIFVLCSPPSPLHESRFAVSRNIITRSNLRASIHRHRKTISLNNGEEPADHHGQATTKAHSRDNVAPLCARCSHDSPWSSAYDNVHSDCLCVPRLGGSTGSSLAFGVWVPDLLLRYRLGDACVHATRLSMGNGLDGQGRVAMDADLGLC